MQKPVICKKSNGYFLTLTWKDNYEGTLAVQLRQLVCRVVREDQILMMVDDDSVYWKDILMVVQHCLV